MRPMREATDRTRRVTETAIQPATTPAAKRAVQAILIPTPAGAWYALAPGAPDPRRSVLRHLLRNGARRAPSLEELCEWTQCPDSREARMLLFRMQRDGWLSGDVEPLPERRDAVGDRLAMLLEALSDRKQALLADDAGLCVAATGMEEAMAERLASLAPVMQELCRPFAIDGTQEGQASYVSGGSASSPGWTLNVLDLGRLRLFLTVCGPSQRECEAVVELGALLLRRYDP